MTPLATQVAPASEEDELATPMKSALLHQGHLSLLLEPLDTLESPARNLVGAFTEARNCLLENDPVATKRRQLVWLQF